MFFPEVSPSAEMAMYHVDRFLALLASPIEWMAASVGSVEAASPSLAGSV